MSTFLVAIVSHAGMRMQFAAIARCGLDAQLQALDWLTAPPRFCPVV